MKVTTLGIDLAKNRVHIHGMDKRGCFVISKALRRKRFKEFMVQLPSCMKFSEVSDRVDKNFQVLSDK